MYQKDLEQVNAPSFYYFHFQNRAESKTKSTKSYESRVITRKTECNEQIEINCGNEKCLARMCSRWDIYQ